ncbi:hypothetical protein C8F04DRAFT_1243226 [Mycena alexandri]|uniref:Uncharacterized protein n=1 Tax=Mycena alexandri TaxID=1745969 RepID=A0AAD6WMT2_9AGAR|nr:hypothetical protein C8F04DRAFT_1243226 [Mycena alexandri]
MYGTRDGAGWDMGADAPVSMQHRVRAQATRAARAPQLAAAPHPRRVRDGGVLARNHGICAEARAHARPSPHLTRWWGSVYSGDEGGMRDEGIGGWMRGARGGDGDGEESMRGGNEAEGGIGQKGGSAGWCLGVAVHMEAVPAVDGDAGEEEDVAREGEVSDGVEEVAKQKRTNRGGGMQGVGMTRGGERVSCSRAVISIPVFSTAHAISYLFIWSSSVVPAGAKNSSFDTFLHILTCLDDQSYHPLSDKYWISKHLWPIDCPEGKHQLCFGHTLRAIKKRLVILRRTPAHYDVELAHAEFNWIVLNFVPLGQSKEVDPDTLQYVATTAVPHVTV